MCGVTEIKQNNKQKNAFCCQEPEPASIYHVTDLYHTIPYVTGIYHTIPWVCYRRRNQWLRLAIPYHTISSYDRRPTSFSSVLGRRESIPPTDMRVTMTTPPTAQHTTTHHSNHRTTQHTCALGATPQGVMKQHTSLDPLRSVQFSSVQTNAPFTEGCAGANKKASPPGRHQEQAPTQRCTFRPTTFERRFFDHYHSKFNDGVNYQTLPPGRSNMLYF